VNDLTCTQSIHRLQGTDQSAEIDNWTNEFLHTELPSACSSCFIIVMLEKV